MSFSSDVSGGTIKRRLYVFMLQFVAVTLYLLFGGIVLHIIEDPLESSRRQDMQEAVDRIIISHSLNYETMKTLQEEGMCDFHFYNDTTFHPKWTLSGATFFSLTVITTIGYGNQVPGTYTGRSFTVFYAILGIGIVSQLLGSCATTLLSIMKRLGKRVGKCCSVISFLFDEDDDTTDIPKPDGVVHLEAVFPLHDWERLWVHHMSDGYCPLIHLPDLLHSLTDEITRDKPELRRELLNRIGQKGELMQHVMDSAERDKKNKISAPELARLIALFYTTASSMPRRVHYKTLIRLFALCCAWACVWAVVFLAFEDWSYREALWFCAVTMSTIGFGDYTPDNALSKLMAYVFIITGVGLAAAALQAVWEWFDEKRFWFLQKYATHKMIQAHEIPVCLNPERRFDSPRMQPLKSPAEASIGEGTLQVPLADLNDTASADTPLADCVPHESNLTEGGTRHPFRQYRSGTTTDDALLPSSPALYPAARPRHPGMSGSFRDYPAPVRWVRPGGSLPSPGGPGPGPGPGAARERRRVSRAASPLRLMDSVLDGSVESGRAASPEVNHVWHTPVGGVAPSPLHRPGSAYSLQSVGGVGRTFSFFAEGSAASNPPPGAAKGPPQERKQSSDPPDSFDEVQRV